MHGAKFSPMSYSAPGFLNKDRSVFHLLCCSEILCTSSFSLRLVCKMQISFGAGLVKTSASITSKILHSRITSLIVHWVGTQIIRVSHPRVEIQVVAPLYRVSNMSDFSFHIRVGIPDMVSWNVIEPGIIAQEKWRCGYNGCKDDIRYKNDMIFF